MNVRSKLALSSGIGLLILLGVFYVGGRAVVLFSLKQAANSLTRSLPEVRRTIEHEHHHLASLATATAESTALRALLNHEKESQPQDDSHDWSAAFFENLGVDALVATDSNGVVLVEWLRNGGQQSLTNDVGKGRSELALHLAPNMRLTTGFGEGRMQPVSGLLALSNGVMLISAAPVVGQEETGKPLWLGVVAVGKSLEDAGLLRRISPGYPAVTTTTCRELPLSEAQVEQCDSGATVAESFVFDIPVIWRINEPVRARLPLYDVYGQPVVSLLVNLPHSFKGLAELALSWLTLFIACVGVLFVIPIFVIQGRTVLNPLTKLVRDLKALGNGGPTKQRLNWERGDEFGIVADTIDKMLAAIDRDHDILAANNAHMRTLLTSTPDLIFSVNSRGVVTEIATKQGERICRIFGNLAVGQNLALASGEAPPAGAAFLGRIKEVLSSGCLQFYEYNLKRDGTAPCWVEIRMARLSDEEVMVLVRDITDRHHALHERARIEAKMAQLQKTESLGVLAGGMAHDFNNILTAMLGNLEALTQERLSPAAEEAIENIRLAMIRASTLTRQILSYAGQGNFTFENINLNELLRDLVRLMKRTIAPQIELLTAFGSAIPLAKADATQIWQVVMNLILNASDAMASLSGSIVLTTLHVRPERSELDTYHSLRPLVATDYVMIEVSDTGHGMDARTLERIFDPFFTTKSMGRGLGLSACLGIIRAHEGGVNVRSKPGAGTRFRILLPAAHDEQGKPIPAPPAAPESDVAGALKDAPRGSRLSGVASGAVSAEKPAQKILVADDDPAIIRLIEIILKERGMEIVTASSGEEALALFDADPGSFALALLDGNMGSGMSGSETCVALRARKAGLPTIVMSGYREHELNMSGSASVNEFLAKPFMSNDLLVTISKVLEQAQEATPQPAP